MRFSDHYGIDYRSTDAWFDPVLSLDTELFIDPFLVYAQEFGFFRGSHRHIINFFNSVYQLIAKSHGRTEDLKYKRAIDLLMFPERQELCLGYTFGGTGGAGSGSDIAKSVAGAMWESIEAGIEEITHFEQVSIFREGIGPDRISDITALLLYERFAKYTQAVCKKHNIPTEKMRIQRGRFDHRSHRWLPLNGDLPRNPYNGRPVLLVPQVFLDSLPEINPGDFWDYCRSAHHATLREEFGDDIGSKVSKKMIVGLAKRHPDFVKSYLLKKERQKPRAYNFKKDPKGRVAWYDASLDFVSQNPSTESISSTDDFIVKINRFVTEYKRFVEDNAGWKLLWNDNATSKSEEAAQLLFLGVVKHYCYANDIDISRETNIGRGPVDFKISNGSRLRVLLELKLARNSKFWRGLTKQLPKYLDAEDVNRGYFIVIAYSDQDQRRIGGLRRKVRELNKQTSYKIDAIVVDARSDKVSASKL